MKKRIVALLLVVATLLSMIGAGVPTDVASDEPTTAQVETTVEPTPTPEATAEPTATPEVTVEPTPTPEVTPIPEVTPPPIAENTGEIATCTVCQADPCICETNEEICDKCEHDPCICTIWETVGEAQDVTLIGYLNKTADTIVFFDDNEKDWTVASGDCPDFVVLKSVYPDQESGEPVFYIADSFDLNFWDSVIAYAQYIKADQFSTVVPAVGLYATVSPNAGNVTLYRDLGVATDAKFVSAADLNGEYVVAELFYEDTLNDWFVKLTADENWPEDAEEYVWISAAALASLSRTPTQQPDEPVCDICGKTDCNGVHRYCTVCENYTCTETHLYCVVCKKYDCPISHKYCTFCGTYDCGIDHAAEFKPVTAPVIPDYTLPEGTDSAIVNENGETITDGLHVPKGTKVSLSAWSVLDDAADVTYQWQIRYDAFNDLWADIHGQTGKGILVSPAMVQSIIDLQGSAAIRCVTTAGEESVISESIPVDIADNSAVMTMSRVSSPAYNAVALAEDDSGDGNTDETDAQADSTDIVSVTIEFHYRDRNQVVGDMVMDPYVARVIKGNSLYVPIPCKVFPGYSIVLGTPMEDVTLENNEITLDFPSVNDNIKILVYYDEIMVPYFARFYMQNVYNDLYAERTDVLTEADRESMKGYAGSEPNESLIHPNVTGFTALFHQPDKIAADGSTVFEVYYDRNYYLINFDLDGGFGTYPVYARYETSFTVATPTKPGYTFRGWQVIKGTVPTDAEVDSDGLVKKIPADNLTYKAIWEQHNTQYHVAYWRENAEDNNYTIWGVAEKTALSGTTIDGTDDIPQTIHKGEKSYFTFNSVLSDQDVVIEGDGSTVINVYYNRNYYTITFRAPGKCTIPTNHTHTDSCYDYICLSGNHTHTTECLVCEKTVHIHGASCCTLSNHDKHDSTCCTLIEHSKHTDKCCSLSHTHDRNCYTVLSGGTLSSDEETSPTWISKLNDADPNDNGVYSVNYNIWNTRYYLKIGNAYYQISEYSNRNFSYSITCGKIEHTHGDGNCNCTKTLHTHGDGNCICGTHAHTDGGCICAIPAHQHDSSCYNCGTEEHTHVAACRRLICDIPTGHTHSSTCTNSSRTNTVKIVTRKYQQSLDDIWHHTENGESVFGLVDDNGVVYDNGERWSPSSSSYYSQVLVYISNMPGDDFTLTLDTSSNTTRTMNYYLQVLPGEAYDVTYNGKNYKLHNTIKANYGYVTKDEDFFDIYGYVQSASNPTFNSSGQIKNATTINFYYDRITDHELKFYNNGLLMEDKTVLGRMYGLPLKGYYFKPGEPSNLEPNGYEFDQWFTTSEFIPGTEVDWDTLTMPIDDLPLYARWLPIVHDVYFYLDYEHYKAKSIYRTVEDTPHGENMVLEGTLQNDILYPKHENSSYKFVGWFYIDEDGDKVAFNPSEMAVREDLHLYAEWTSSVITSYTVSYAEGTWDDATQSVIPKTGDAYRMLADDVTGYAMEASTRTFNAKPANQLKYLTLEELSKAIWVPHTNSHSILMKSDIEENSFTFYYISRTNVPYTIRYLDSATGLEVLADERIAENSDAIITAQFKYVPGYIPDEFYKTLILSANDAENVITFYYTKDEEATGGGDDPIVDVNARYHVTHYVETLVEGEYEEYTTDSDVGEIGKEVQITPLTIVGFTFDHGTPNVKETTDGKKVVYGTIRSGKDDNENKALALELYYKRNEYHYYVEYRDYETGALLMGPVKSTDKYHLDEEVTFTTTEVIRGYDLYGSATQKLKISATESLNKITFLYAPKALTVNYIPVCKTNSGSDFGYVLATSEYKIINGTTAVANPGYRFMGWYSEEACTTKLTDNAFYKPNVSTDNDIYEYNFYALFEPIALKIYQTGVADTHSGIYEIVKSSDVIAKVMITGNTYVTLDAVPIGTYTIEEITSEWTWTYDPDNTDGSLTFTVTTAGPNEVTFNHSAKTVDWLHSENAK